MESVTKAGIQRQAKFKGTDPLGIYHKDETYLIVASVEPSGEVLVVLGTGKGKRNYPTIVDYRKDWEELNGTDEMHEQPQYVLTITYNADGTPNLNHKNSGMREADVVMCLEIAKLHLLQEITGGGKRNKS